ncbi:hypothetical protein [Dyadobacter arcticus]|uniref:Membrane protein n=1 Tax=Dyadobacter arcticus TaxID=1078754 RepID=A0ABX0US78_9BACT|nr:hypothetical protein [Dyadobacter arcticus]NIJ55662.1 putative membrane protein [Dyadobacter arcticus]
MERVYRNSHYLFIAVLLMAFVGFHKTYFSKIPDFQDITSVMHLHAFTVLLWFAILIAQPLLIRTKRTDLHRLVGKISYVVVPMVILSIFLLMRIAFIRNSPVLPGQPDIRLIGIADITFFALTYLLAIYYRRNVKYHARYMVLSVLPFINPSLGRLGIPRLIVGLFMMLGLIIYERFNNKVYRPYLIGLPAYVAIYAFFLFVIDADQWRAFWWMFF